MTTRSSGGGDRDVHDGGGGDVLRAKDGTKDRVLGGPGRDRARVDGKDEVVGVEVIQ